MTEKPTLYLMVGLPGSGKTTRAKELEQATRAVRFTPDEWHIFLFGDDFGDNSPAARALHGQRHDRVEQLMWTVGQDLLRKGVSVILDFGFWAKSSGRKSAGRPRPWGQISPSNTWTPPLPELKRRVAQRNQANPAMCSPPSPTRTWRSGTPSSSPPPPKNLRVKLRKAQLTRPRTAWEFEKLPFRSRETALLAALIDLPGNPLAPGPTLPRPSGVALPHRGAAAPRRRVGPHFSLLTLPFSPLSPPPVSPAGSGPAPRWGASRTDPKWQRRPVRTRAPLALAHPLPCTYHGENH